MKKIMIIAILIFNIYNLYADEHFIINDSSIKVLTDAGVDISLEKKYTINSITKKYLKDARKILSEINEINIKINDEFKKENVDLGSVKQLIFEKKAKEADFDYTIMSCDLDILSLFSDNEIKKIKYYIIFKK
ncbi:hypothetical protein JQ824_11775 [Brachyspira hyodysenteriae]|uniref:Uncharacterized protein n=4 Tax=Brachyspira hyodysenteriae TaxID=159 RepID=A0A3B6V924_BRAHW|nr:hypothetical protein [Brachyspira hyodysenteriae]ACN83912.1 hypothetical protein BHWA1_01440 [Brachyspira hyodysenteriae WA1]ANN63974.1 hypothetical protein BHYOB78_08875 [Brachyspira hyodysenteriae ATCC 27164]AUJ49639.1 hypothetical protein BH718_01197 [Brachyspira hyodysenteriae]KLI18435.1 hypothetical protein SU44_02415 [Brachyspira hyodysenteriae]KLI19146.1 hypothetical protein SU45_00730 [Brachyspira hyodysenteriae]